MDARLRRALDAVARDRRSGAAELALAATDAVLEWTRRRRPTQGELEDVARALLRAQPAMVPFLRLANEVALAMDLRPPLAALRRELRRFRAILTGGSRHIARHFRRKLAGEKTCVATYSYSSTVMAALRAARRNLTAVYCSEGRPAMEGRRTAAALARAGIPVLFATDAELLSGFGQYDWKHLVLGADGVFATSFCNKRGTRALVGIARQARARVWVLADSTKFLAEPLPEPEIRSARRRPGAAGRPAGKITAPDIAWPGKPPGIFTFPAGFEEIPYWPALRIVNERGVWTPAEVRGQLHRLRIAPRLAGLAR